MKRFLSFIFLCLTALPVSAATYYVRTDGGTSAQCTGLTNAAYPGSGTGQACAWQHPSIALGVEANGSATGPAALMAGGDTLIIGNGQYGIGFGAGGGMLDGACTAGSAFDCDLRPVPSGTPGNPTRILGEQWGPAGSCKVKPVLWGAERVYRVLHMSGSDHVEVQCLEITDRSACMDGHHLSSLACERTTPPYGNWARDGIYAYDSQNVLLRDLNIHGLSNNGIKASKLVNWTVERVKLTANGRAGWDGNLPGDDDSNSGDMIFRNVEISFNGCGEAWPKLTIVGCWAQAQGGYGDGFGTWYTVGDWLFEDVSVHHNTSDGIDMLYIEHPGTSTFNRVKAYGNAGNQIKTSGITLIENSLISSNCDYFGTRYSPAMLDSDMCRASGNALSLSPPNITGVAATVRYSTITGKGDCLINLSMGTHGATAAAVMNFENNLLFGNGDVKQGDRSCLSYAFGNPHTINFRSNFVWDIKLDLCPPTSNCAYPAIRDDNPDTFDGRPLPGSLLIGAGNTSWPTPAADINGKPRPANPTVGAFEP